jgi:hypothetical protein
MATIYQIWADEGYQSPEPDDGDAYLAMMKSKWKFDGTPIGRSWKPPEVYVQFPLLCEPDIWEFFPSFAFTEAAASKLQRFLDQAGEQLPLYHEGRKLTLLNITYCLNCLDKKRSVYDPELPHMIDEYVFRRDRLEYSLFKIPEQRYGRCWFCTEGVAAPDDEFKAMVEKYGLTGLRFTEVWSEG